MQITTTTKVLLGYKNAPSQGGAPPSLNPPLCAGVTVSRAQRNSGIIQRSAAAPELLQIARRNPTRYEPSSNFNALRPAQTFLRGRTVWIDPSETE